MTGLDPQIRELVAKDAVRQALFRYCRGVDRGDEAALRAVFWPDAYDEHGFYNGPIEGFITIAVAFAPRAVRSIHRVSNMLIEFVGEDVAAVETYWYAYQHAPRLLAGGELGSVERWSLSGRYLDRFERRGGEWRIARRKVIFDRSEQLTVFDDVEDAPSPSRSTVGAAFPDDPLYHWLQEQRG